jgi:hypothetical protein
MTYKVPKSIKATVLVYSETPVKCLYPNLTFTASPLESPRVFNPTVPTPLVKLIRVLEIIP